MKYEKQLKDHLEKTELYLINTLGEEEGKKSLNSYKKLIEDLRAYYPNEAFENIVKLNLINWRVAKMIKCEKCGSERIYVEVGQIHKKASCVECGSFIKFLTKDEYTEFLRESRLKVDMISIDKINYILNKEIEFAKGCGMPQFVMGLQQAQKVLNDYMKEKEI